MLSGMASHNGIVLRFRSGAQAPSDRLDRWLASQVAAKSDGPDLSRSRIKDLIQKERVFVDGATVTNPAATVKSNGLYVIEVPALVPATPKPESIQLDIVYEDDDLIVIDKPPGLVVHPAPGAPDGTLVNALLSHCGDSLSGIGGVRRPGIVHRLDKDTTGLIVAAKNDETHHALAHQFAARTVKRSYLALVWGVPDRIEGRIEGAIGRSRHNPLKMAVTARGGKAAATRFRLIERFRDISSLVECRLESGRTHQIRVHMTHIGHPVVGDPMYGSGGKRKGATAEELIAVATLGRQALHANTLTFTHPGSGDSISFTADPPEQMRNVISVFANA